MIEPINQSCTFFCSILHTFCLSSAHSELLKLCWDLPQRTHNRLPVWATQVETRMRAAWVKTVVWEMCACVCLTVSMDWRVRMCVKAGISDRIISAHLLSNYRCSNKNVFMLKLRCLQRFYLQLRLKGSHKSSEQGSWLLSLDFFHLYCDAFIFIRLCEALVNNAFLYSAPMLYPRVTFDCSQALSSYFRNVCGSRCQSGSCQ